MEEPRARVVGGPPDSHIVCGSCSDVDNIATDRVVVVVGGALSATDNTECVLQSKE